jgi:hypothetical protein
MDKVEIIKLMKDTIGNVTAVLPPNSVYIGDSLIVLDLSILPSVMVPLACKEIQKLADRSGIPVATTRVPVVIPDKLAFVLFGTTASYLMDTLENREQVKNGGSWRATNSGFILELPPQLGLTDDQIQELLSLLAGAVNDYSTILPVRVMIISGDKRWGFSSERLDVPEVIHPLVPLDDFKAVLDSCDGMDIMDVIKKLDNARGSA